MRKTFTKKDLRTGDIIETRNGERGVVILELDCILYQAGGLDIFEEVITDDLFIDGPQREGDIFKVYRDTEGPLGFNKLFGLDPIFQRRNDKRTRERAAELSEKHDRTKGKVSVILFNSWFRRCERSHTDPCLSNRLAGQDAQVGHIDMDISEAPSMTACGQIEIDRTFIPVPGTENLYIFYSVHQEEWRRKMWEEDRMGRHHEEREPIIIIPEIDISIYSRCMLVRKESSDKLTNLKEGDYEAVLPYLNKMELL